MSKAVMLSIRPKWCEKIINGEKTIEVRKTRPKLQTPYKCYIYCTAGNLSYKTPDGMICHCCGCREVIGEFTCDEITRVNICGFWDEDGKQLENQLEKTCMTAEQFRNYLGTQVGYGWRITDLHIYDMPRKLSEFTGLRDTKFGAAPYDIKRAPQSWCYVEAAKEGEKA